MTAPTFVPITNEPRDYAWGMPGGISRALGRQPTDRREAELWLGAHPLSPSRAQTSADWSDLAQWEEQTGGQLPFLMKLLAAESPLSLQAHPTAEQARLGFAREDALGIDRAAPERSYKDPHSKPELIVAIEDGFEALCGFRPIVESLAVIDELTQGAGELSSPHRLAPLHTWRAKLSQPGGLRSTVAWLLSGDPGVADLVSLVVAVAGREPERFELVLRLAAQYPGDAGILVALLLNHVTLTAGECLWLPAGNIHAYLRGIGVELMGPSDNVLRGGLTPKHIDVNELLNVLDFSDGPPPRLVPENLGSDIVRYRPSALPSGADVRFELCEITGDAVVSTRSAAIGLLLDGEFAVRAADATHRLDRGDAVFLPEASDLSLTGQGRLFLASAD